MLIIFKRHLLILLLSLIGFWLFFIRLKFYIVVSLKVCIVKISIASFLHLALLTTFVYKLINVEICFLRWCSICLFSCAKSLRLKNFRFWACYELWFYILRLRWRGNCFWSLLFSNQRLRRHSNQRNVYLWSLILISPCWIGCRWNISNSLSTRLCMSCFSLSTWSLSIEML